MWMRNTIATKNRVMYENTRQLFLHLQRVVRLFGAISKYSALKIYPQSILRKEVATTLPWLQNCVSRKTFSPLQFFGAGFFPIVSLHCERGRRNSPRNCPLILFIFRAKNGRRNGLNFPRDVIADSHYS